MITTPVNQLMILYSPLLLLLVLIHHGHGSAGQGWGVIEGIVFLATAWLSGSLSPCLSFWKSADKARMNCLPDRPSSRREDPRILRILS